MRYTTFNIHILFFSLLLCVLSGCGIGGPKGSLTNNAPDVTLFVSPSCQDSLAQLSKMQGESLLIANDKKVMEIVPVGLVHSAMEYELLRHILCAQEQSKGLIYLQKLSPASQTPLNRTQRKLLGLKENKFLQCLHGNAELLRIKSQANASAQNVQAVPSFRGEASDIKAMYEYATRDRS